MMGGAGNIGGLGLGGMGLGLTNFSAGPAPGVSPAAGPSSGPAVTVGISPEALGLLSQAASFGGSSALNGIATQAVTGVGSLANTGGLANKLVDAAVIAAVLDDSRDKDQDGNNKLATALIISAAVQAYQQVANMPGVSVVTPVMGTGASITISTGAGA